MTIDHPIKMKGQAVGITGSLGAGKSTVSRVLEELGYPVFSADVLAREVVAPGAPALVQIRGVFGDNAISPDGTLNRAWVREAISKDSGLRLALEGITHPLIQARSRELTEEAFARGAAIVFYEAPLLFEAKSERGLDAVICVAASEDTRLDRVVARDGVTRAQAKALLDAQMPQEEKIARSQYIIWNDGSLAAARTETLKVLASLLGPDGLVPSL